MKNKILNVISFAIYLAILVTIRYEFGEKAMWLTVVCCVCSGITLINKERKM